MGHVEVIKGIIFKGSEKDIYVHVPTNKEPWIPIVIYDGQFVFDIYPSRHPLGINLQIDMMIKEGKIPPVMLIGIPSEANRMNNLSPWHNDCLDFLKQILIPYIENTYPIRRPYLNIGFSAGGQMAIYLSRYEGVFHGAGAILPIWTPSEHYRLPKFIYPTYIITNSQGEAEKFKAILKENTTVDINRDANHSVDFFREKIPYLIQVLLRHVKV